MGSQHQLHSVRSCEQALRAVGVAGGRPRGGASRRCKGRLWLGAHPLPAARPWGRHPGPAVHLLWARVCRCGDPALSLWVACHAGCCAPRGWAEAAAGRGPLTAVRHVWCQALSVSRLPILGAGSRAPLPMFAGRGWCGCGDPAPAPQPALLRAGVARSGVGRGGTASRRCEGRLELGACPLPSARPWGKQSEFAAHLLGARACGCGDPALSLWRACPAGRCAPQGRQEAAPGGGSTSHRCQVRLVSGALPLLAACPCGGQPGSCALVSRTQVVWA